MSAVRILALSGSLQKDSFNQRLLDLAVQIARSAGADVTSVHLAELDLPLYSQDVEARAFPENARRLKALFCSHEGFLIASPEHNGSVTTALKNAIDWVSRPTDDETALALSAFRGKTAGLMSASPSPFGGMRSIVHLRQILGTLQTLVVPEQVCVTFAHSAFDDSGLRDGIVSDLLPVLVHRVVRQCRAGLQ